MGILFDGVCLTAFLECERLGGRVFFFVVRGSDFSLHDSLL